MKHVDLLLDAFVAIAADRPDWDLVVLGDGPLKANLMTRVPAEVAKRVRWLGFVDNQELVSAIYRSCHVLVLPCDYEPWALVVNEAAAAGLAIVASDAVGAAAELVRTGVNGEIFRSGNLPDLCAKVMLAMDPDKIERLKTGSNAVLAEWRESADPVDGLRRALSIASK